MGIPFLSNQNGRWSKSTIWWPNPGHPASMASGNGCQFTKDLANLTCEIVEILGCPKQIQRNQHRLGSIVWGRSQALPNPRNIALLKPFRRKHVCLYKKFFQTYHDPRNAIGESPAFFLKIQYNEMMVSWGLACCQSSRKISCGQWTLGITSDTMIISLYLHGCPQCGNKRRRSFPKGPQW
jgi:hypothetical protein